MVKEDLKRSIFCRERGCGQNKKYETDLEVSLGGEGQGC